MVHEENPGLLFAEMFRLALKMKEFRKDSNNVLKALYASVNIKLSI